MSRNKGFRIWVVEHYHTATGWAPFLTVPDEPTGKKRVQKYQAQGMEVRLAYYERKGVR